MISLTNKFKNTQNYMSSFNDRLRNLIKIELGRDRKRKVGGGRSVSNKINYTNAGSKSLTSSKTTSPNESLRFIVKGLSYLEKVDQGGQTDADVQDLIPWIRKKVKLRDYQTGRFLKMDDYSVRKVATQIKRKLETVGVNPTNFLDDAIEIAYNQLNQIETPLVKDVNLNLDEMLLAFGYKRKGNDLILKIK